MLNVTEKTTDQEIKKAAKAFWKKLDTRADLYGELLVLKRHIALKMKALRRQGLELHAEITKLERKVKELKGN